VASIWRLKIAKPNTVAIYGLAQKPDGYGVILSSTFS